MPQKRFFVPSFSGWLRILSRGFVWQDNESYIYMFGCSLEGIKETWQNFNNSISFSRDQIALDKKEVMSILFKAEEENRLKWQDYSVMSSAKLKWLKESLLIDNGDLGPGDIDIIPSLREWTSYFPWITFLDYEYFQRR